jgi:uncharacterized protein YqjF (DUF2071 family)
MNKVFLTAEWKNLIMANYAIDPAVLQTYLPKYTELDYFDDRCYISLVGFVFDKVKIKGISIPFHTRFPEVNLRFYVKRKEGNAWRRGVVFMSEIVPKPAIVWVANTLYNEKYKSLKMKEACLTVTDSISVEYDWKWKGVWNAISVKALNQPRVMTEGSKEAFIFENYYGYSKQGERTNEYQVAHPSWNIYPVLKHGIFCNFEEQYGKEFAVLNQQEPGSVFLADGSAVSIGGKRKLF